MKNVALTLSGFGNTDMGCNFLYFFISVCTRILPSQAVNFIFS